MDLDGYSDVVNGDLVNGGAAVNAGETVNAARRHDVDQVDCTTAEHHAVPVDQVLQQGHAQPMHDAAAHHDGVHSRHTSQPHMDPSTVLRYSAPAPDTPGNTLLRPQPRRSYDVETTTETTMLASDRHGGNRGHMSLDAGTRQEAVSGVWEGTTATTVRRRQVSWMDPVPLWSVDHFAGVAPGGPSRAGTLQSGDATGGRGSLEHEYYTTREWEGPVHEEEAGLQRSSV